VGVYAILCVTVLFRNSLISSVIETANPNRREKTSSVI
jgi:hypothetical protein